MMYDELRGNLMAHATHFSVHDETSLLLLKAADSIEELQKALDAVNDAHNEGYDVGYLAGRRDYEPKWIPVTERFPELGEVVLLTDGKDTGDGYLAICPLWSTPFVDLETENITHWMPLPQPPKDDEERQKEESEQIYKAIKSKSVKTGIKAFPETSESEEK